MGGPLISPAQARRDRAILLRDLHRDQRRRFLRRLAELRDEEDAARVERRAELARARDRCVTRAEEATRAAADAYTRALELAKLAKLATRQVARDQCALERKHARDEGTHKIDHAKKERAEERRFAAELVRLERGAKASEAERRQRTRRGERRAESDDEVRGNLEPELVPLFELLKRTIKGSDRQSRTEAFRQYAEEHQAEVYEAQEREAERALRRDVKKHRAEGAEAARAPRAPARARARDELPGSAFVAPRRARAARPALSAVPF